MNCRKIPHEVRRLAANQAFQEMRLGPARHDDPRMRVLVDFDRCDSTGLCAQAAPEVFELGEDDVLRVRSQRPAERHWASAELAARSCPKLAITLLDDRRTP